MEELLNVALEFREGSSDKVYKAAIEKTDGGFVVNFAYGRRGSTLTTGTKTSSPVPYEKAVDVFDKLVKSKTVKGYKPAGTQSGIGSSVTDRQQRDTGMRAQLLVPITEDEAGAYLEASAWCAQEKYDGKRMMIRKSGVEIVAANRNGLSVGFPDAVSAGLKLLADDFVIDGECVGDTFYAFDLLEHGRDDHRSAPYLTRLGVLRHLLGNGGGSVIVASTAIGQAKKGLWDKLKDTKKEGVVFKNLEAPWYAGRPASGGGAFKCKFWASCSCVVCKVNARRSVEVALGGKSVGNVTIPPNHVIPEVGQVVEIRYLYVAGAGGSLYQPIYLGVRDDVAADECTFERQQVKYKPEEEG